MVAEDGAAGDRKEKSCIQLDGKYLASYSSNQARKISEQNMRTQVARGFT